jgi:hypothetical protein
MRPFFDGAFRMLGIDNLLMNHNLMLCGTRIPR